MARDTPDRGAPERVPPFPIRQGIDRTAFIDSVITELAAMRDDATAWRDYLEEAESTSVTDGTR